MPKENRDYGTNTAPHFDGEQETISQDSIGNEIGLKVERSHNPYNVKKLKNDELHDFQKMTEGHPIDSD